jgi:hypothetical protein
MMKHLPGFLVSLICFLVINTNVSSQTYTLGTGTASNTATAYPSPYGNYYESSKHQFLIRATELTALGMTSCKITSIAFNVMTVSGGLFEGYTIKMKQTGGGATEVLNNIFANGMTTVYGPANYVDVPGWNTHTFSEPFCWDGTSNIIVETCFYSSNYSNNARVYNSTLGFNCDHYINADGANECVLASGGTVNAIRPNMRFTTIPPSTDVSALSLTTPKQIVNLGSSNSVSFKFKNLSCSGSIATANVGYRWNNDAPVTAGWTGTLTATATGSYAFSIPFTASTPGFNTLKIWVNGPDGMTPDGNVLNDTLIVPIFVETASAAPAVTLSSTDYWFTFPENSSSSAYQLIINSSYCAKGSVIFPLLGGYSQNFSITPGTSLTMVVPTTISGQQIYHNVPDAVENKGFRIVSDSAVTVSVVPYQSASVDGEFILPASMLGTNYIVNSRAVDPLDPITTNITVGATQDNTSVLVCNSVSGACIKVLLNAGQTYMVSSSTSNCNTEDNVTNYDVFCQTMTGSRVISDKPVYVLGHADCSGMGYCGACDHLIAQAIPLPLLGNKYALAQPVRRNAANSATCLPGSVPLPAIPSMADFVEITGKIGTTGTITRQTGMAGGSTVTFTIPANGPFDYGYYWYYNPKGTGGENIGECNILISTDNPVQVVQYGQGWQTDNQGFTDPEMILIFPESFWQSEYLFATSSSLTSINNVVIVVDNTNTGAGNPISLFQLDGAAVPGTGWQPLGTGNYRFIRRSLSFGTAAHVIRNTGGYKFAIYANAVGTAESYTTHLGGSPVRYPFVTSCNVVVPVKLISFKVLQESGFNKLNWTTASENSCVSYAIERSAEGLNYVEIGSLPCANTAESRTYEFTDKSFPYSLNYYRLRKTEANGAVSYSETRLINNIRKFQLNNITYLKEGNNFSLSYYSPAKETKEVKIYDIAGRLITVINHTFSQGENKETLPGVHLGKGIYFVRINETDQASSIHSKFVIE